MKDLNIYNKNLLNKVKLSSDWKRMASIIGITSVIASNGFLLGCESANLKEEHDSEEIKLEESIEEHEDETHKIGEIFEALVNYNVPLDERGFSLVLDIKEILTTEDIISRKTGELIKVEDLKEKYGDFWGVFYASHLSDLELKKVITYRDYMFEALPSEVVLEQEVVIMKYFIVRDAFSNPKGAFYYGDLWNETFHKYDEVVNPNSLENQNVDAMKYKTALTDASSYDFITKTMSHGQKINEASREELELTAGRMIMVGDELERIVVENGYDITYVWEEKDIEIPGMINQNSKQKKK